MPARTILLLAATLIIQVIPTLAVDTTSPLVVAHRGLLRHSPENTLANFRACLERRIGFEVDVQRTKDGHLVCIHDDTVDRTTTGTGKVSDLMLAELKTLDAGSWFDSAFRGERVPTLDEVFETLSRYPHRVLVAMDLKAADVEEDAVHLATKHHVPDKVLFIGRTISTPEVRRRLRRAARKAQIAVVANNREELTAAISDQYADWVYVRFVHAANDPMNRRQSVKGLDAVSLEADIIAAHFADRVELGRPNV